MTKRHFDRLAAELAYVRTECIESAEKAAGWEAAVDAVADACQASNPRFDRDRFIQACRSWDRIKAIQVIDR